MKRRPYRRDEGAIAVIVAMMSVALFAIAAFAVDFGQAYTTKRQLSTAADSAVLAAARYYATQPGSCTQLSSPLDPNYLTRLSTAKSIAKQYLDQNIGAANLDDLTVACSPDLKSLDVYFADSRTNSATFSQIAGVKQITTSRSATAEVYVPTSGDAVPYMLCFSDLPIVQNPLGGSTIEKISYPGNCKAYQDDKTVFSGNWYTVNCPEDSPPFSTGNSNDSKNLAKFCDMSVTSIDVGSADTPTAEDTARQKCQGEPFSASPGCLRGNQGDPSQTKVRQFWDANVLGKDVLLPVFYTNTVTKDNAGSHWPVVGFQAVHVCGYYWGPNKSNQITDNVCTASANTFHYDAKADNSPTNYILVVRSQYISGGNSRGHADCAISDGNTPGCDGGNRAVSLIK